MLKAILIDVTLILGVIKMCSNENKYQEGDRVTIYNHSLSGKVIVEGEATLVQKLDHFICWFVLFDGEDERPVRRHLYAEEELENKDYD